MNQSPETILSMFIHLTAAQRMIKKMIDEILSTEEENPAYVEQYKERMSKMFELPWEEVRYLLCDASPIESMTDPKRGDRFHTVYSVFVTQMFSAYLMGANDYEIHCNEEKEKLSSSEKLMQDAIAKAQKGSGGSSIH
jgi:hypothetical protein